MDTGDLGMSPRIRPRLQDYKDAQDLFWLGDGGYNMIEDRVDGRWTVFASRDVFNHEVHSTEASLADAIRVARELEKSLIDQPRERQEGA
jgi:hypothetical protein